jgi:DUF438 domain-containing protein
MKEEYQKISNLRHRDRITSKDIDFIHSMHNKYCSQLKKNICWQCPNSIREAIQDLIRFVENNPFKDEDKTITIEQPSRIGEGSSEVPKRSKGRKPSTGSK